MCAGAANQTDLLAQLTLSQALQIALSNSTTIREAMAGLDQASGQYQQARSYLLPQLNLGIRQSYQTINPTILRGVTLKDAPWSALWPNLAALAGFEVVLFSISAWRFRKQ